MVGGLDYSPHLIADSHDHCRDNSDDMRTFKEEKRNIDETNHALASHKILVGSLEHANESLQGQIRFVPLSRVCQSLIMEEYRKQQAEITRLETKLSASMVTMRPAPRSPTVRSASPASPRYRHLSTGSNSPDVPLPPAVILTDRLSKLQANYSTLEAKNRDLAEEIEELSAIVEALKGDLGVARARREATDSRKSSIGYSSTLGMSVLSRPSPVLSPTAIEDLVTAAESDAFRLAR